MQLLSSIFASLLKFRANGSVQPEIPAELNKAESMDPEFNVNDNKTFPEVSLAMKLF